MVDLGMTIRRTVHRRCWKWKKRRPAANRTLFNTYKRPELALGFRMREKSSEHWRAQEHCQQ